jgi:hypothetical protein
MLQWWIFDSVLYSLLSFCFMIGLGSRFCVYFYDRLVIVIPITSSTNACHIHIGRGVRLACPSSAGSWGLRFSLGSDYVCPESCR